MTYKVTLGSENEFSVKLKTTKLKVQANTEVMVPAQFSDLTDFDTTNKHDQYVIMYNSTTQKYELVNPDKVLSSAAVTEPIQPGLPADFEDVLDVDLDDRIDLDAGGF